MRSSHHVGRPCLDHMCRVGRLGVVARIDLILYGIRILRGRRSNLRRTRHSHRSMAHELLAAGHSGLSTPVSLQHPSVKGSHRFHRRPTATLYFRTILSVRRARLASTCASRCCRRRPHDCWRRVSAISIQTCLHAYLSLRRHRGRLGCRLCGPMQVVHAPCVVQS